MNREKMTIDEAMAIIRKEYLCVDRDCDIEKNCGKCDLMMPSKEPILEAYKMAIKALEREPCEDAVSRQAVQDYIAKYLSQYLYNDVREAVEVIDEYIGELPSVNPMPCENAISRQAVRHILNHEVKMPIKVWKKVFELVDDLPPVTPQPKTGHWIRVTDKTGHLVWECDKCSWQQRFNTNFCPDCGARMIEPQERSDKE